MSWAQDGTDLLEKALRNAYQDYGVRLLASDASAFRWDQETYTPSAFQMVSGTKSYTLPPDFLRMKSITPAVGVGQAGVSYTLGL